MLVVATAGSRRRHCHRDHYRCCCRHHHHHVPPNHSPTHILSPSELPPAALWKNLWITNNLEQYRAHEKIEDKSSGPDGKEEGKGDEAEDAKQEPTVNTSTLRYPKVLITVRSELLSGYPGYRSHFLPVEGQNDKKDEEVEAGHYCQELRFTSFGDKRKDYQSQYVALLWRDLFATEVAPKMLEKPMSRLLFTDSKIETNFKLINLGSAKLELESILGIFKETFEASSVELSNSTDTSGSSMVDTLSRWFKALHSGNTGGLGHEHWDRAVCRTVMLAVAARLDPVKDLNGVAQFLRKHTAGGDDQTWTAHHYNTEFEKVPELKELTK